MSPKVTTHSPIDDRPFARVALEQAGVMDPPSRGLLYHYTSADGFLSIVRAGLIRATEVEYFNDTSDGAYGFSLLEPELTRFARLGSEVLSSTIRALVTERRRELRFAACFTEHHDHLGQWYGYAEDGAGYALGFEHSALAGRDGNKPLLRVTYGDDDVRAAFVSTIEWGLRTLEALRRAALPDVEDQIASLLASVATAIVFVAFASKKEVFRPEAEWRLAYSESVFREFDPSRVNFRSARGLVTPYVELPLPRRADGSLALAAVTCGPVLHEERRADGVAAFLENQGVKGTKVAASEAPLRR